MTDTAVSHRLVDAIQRAGARAGDLDEFFAELSDQVRRVLPFEGALWLGVDPATILASAPARIEAMEASYCQQFWHGEFHDNDAMSFRDLARLPTPAAGLRLSTGGRPARSPRFRDFLQPQGYDDEARVAFRSGSTTWAVAALYREKGRAPFGPEDVELLASISNAVAAVLRDHHMSGAVGGKVTAPGVLIFDAESRLVSANAEARCWLTELFGHDQQTSWADHVAVSVRGDGPQISSVLHGLMSQARAVANGYEDGPVRLRVRDRGGRWLVLHASCLDGSPTGPVAVVVEPAKSGEVAPIIVQAYGLSARERDVLRGVARGLATPDIAASLFLSSHTVRDYIKSIFEKVGVSSRGELIAKLFAEHYADDLHDQMVHLH